jgi:hypothetical protein
MAGERGSSVFADERRNGTLGIPFGIGISPTEVLIGKMRGILITEVPARRIAAAVCDRHPIIAVTSDSGD